MDWMKAAMEPDPAADRDAHAADPGHYHKGRMAAEAQGYPLDYPVSCDVCGVILYEDGAMTAAGRSAMGVAQ